jgi:hypothetical protein
MNPAAFPKLFIFKPLCACSNCLMLPNALLFRKKTATSMMGRKPLDFANPREATCWSWDAPELNLLNPNLVTSRSDFLTNRSLEGNQVAAEGFDPRNITHAARICSSGGSGPSLKDVPKEHVYA